MRRYQKRQKRILGKLSLVALVVVFGFSIVILHSPLSFAEEKPQLSADEINYNFEQISRAGDYFKASYICTLLSAGAMVIGLFSESEEGTIGAILVGGGLSVASVVYQWRAADKLSSVPASATARVKDNLSRVKHNLSRLMYANEFSLRGRYDIPLRVSHSISTEWKKIKISIVARKILEKEQLESLKQELMGMAHETAELCQEESCCYDFDLAILQKTRVKTARTRRPVDQTTTVFSKSLSFDGALATQFK